MVKYLHIKNDLYELDCLEKFLYGLKEEWGLEEQLLMNIRLALEEAIVNVISYAYKGDKDQDIFLTIEKESHRIRMEISDTGIYFNPLEREDPDTTLGLEERQIGGLGIFLVKQLMTEVSYSRQGNKNVLTLIKELP